MPKLELVFTGTDTSKDLLIEKDIKDLRNKPLDHPTIDSHISVCL